MINKNEPYNNLPNLPPNVDFNTAKLLRLTIKASRLLAELKGYCQTLPNPEMLINTIILQESKDSSEIENIVTTQDELYKAVINSGELSEISASTKEVLLYKEALYLGLDHLKTKGLTTNTMVSIMQRLKGTSAGIRKEIGTRLANPSSKEIIYTPPEGEDIIREKLKFLEEFIHDQNEEIDPLIKMALIHYQFEAIHPFADGNGRTGRILNALYLVYLNLLPLPVLYLSSFIIKNKIAYYRLLREVTENKNWIGWIEYMLNAIADTAALSLKKIRNIQELKEETMQKMQEILKTSYSRDLLDLLFSHPYIKIKTLELNNIGHRQTASIYLKKLSKAGILSSVKIGKELYFINSKLMNIISN